MSSSPLDFRFRLQPWLSSCLGFSPWWATNSKMKFSSFSSPSLLLIMVFIAGTESKQELKQMGWTPCSKSTARGSGSENKDLFGCHLCLCPVLLCHPRGFLCPLWPSQLWILNFTPPHSFLTTAPSSDALCFPSPPLVCSFLTQRC